MARKGRLRERDRARAPIEDIASPIITRRLSKRYGDLIAVDNLDLEVHAGEIFGLLGQNGAGKTTTILMLLGLTEPSAGGARVMGLDPTRKPLEVKRRVGYLPDNVGFYDGMSGRENLRYTARLNGLSGPDAERKISEAIEHVGMTARADTRTETYSRGMLQRLGIADALVKDPSVLILDEPTTAIDPIGVVEILDMLRELVRERGLAVLLSSHLLAQVQSVCDRVGIFAAGKLIGVGTVPELAERFGDGGARIEVGFEGLQKSSFADTARLLQTVAGVTEVHAPMVASDAFVVLVKPASIAPAAREAILALASAKGLRLSSIREEQASLDEIYRTAVRVRSQVGGTEVAA
ncbi:MAG TPA: ABC transporter ATP-binding protein [Candidatus Dormibacteraeota bacterium]|nr:ABC transporter ATP-binding protein [Candidatus Dormibacteraeota bacterium]